MKFDYQRLKGERIAKGYTQKDMALKLGVSRNTYVKKESGKSDMSIDELSKIGDILGLTPEKTFTLFFKKVVH